MSTIFRSFVWPIKKGHCCEVNLGKALDQCLCSTIWMELANNKANIEKIRRLTEREKQHPMVFKCLFPSVPKGFPLNSPFYKWMNAFFIFKQLCSGFLTSKTRSALPKIIFWLTRREISGTMIISKYHLQKIYFHIMSMKHQWYD